MLQSPLLHDEAIYIEQAVTKRKKEFIAGRTLARLLLEKFSVSAEQTSLHYFYWMSSLPIPTSDGGYSSYNEALVKTFFPAVFPLEKLNSITN